MVTARFWNVGRLLVVAGLATFLLAPWGSRLWADLCVIGALLMWALAAQSARDGLRVRLFLALAAAVSFAVSYQVAGFGDPGNNPWLPLIFTGPFVAFLLIPELRSRRWREERDHSREEAMVRAARGGSTWRISWDTVTEATAHLSLARKMFTLMSVVFSLVMSVLFLVGLGREVL